MTVSLRNSCFIPYRAGVLKEMSGLLIFYKEVHMNEQEKKKDALQWHPVFYAGIQIELSEEADYLEFENEHQLGTKPKEIDTLIIKKNPEIQIRKNIGKIFRTYNIIEYKSPTDYLSIDDFYKVYGYVCFYKSQSLKENMIPANEITITFVCKKYPINLIKHLKTMRNYRIVKVEDGIYYILGDFFPIQLIITSRLSEIHNFWMKNLTNDLKKKEIAEKMLKEYEKHKKDKLYESVMDIVIHANEQIFEEAKGNMCNALMELMKEEFEEARKAAVEETMKRAEQEKQDMRQQFLDSKLAPIRKKLAKGKSLEEIADELEEDIDTIRELYDQYLV